MKTNFLMLYTLKTDLILWVGILGYLSTQGRVSFFLIRNMQHLLSIYFQYFFRRPYARNGRFNNIHRNTTNIHTTLTFNARGEEDSELEFLDVIHDVNSVIRRYIDLVREIYQNNYSK